MVELPIIVVSQPPSLLRRGHLGRQLECLRRQFCGFVPLSGVLNTLGKCRATQTLFKYALLSMGYFERLQHDLIAVGSGFSVHKGPCGDTTFMPT